MLCIISQESFLQNNLKNDFVLLNREVEISQSIKQINEDGSQAEKKAADMRAKDKLVECGWASI